MSDCCQPRAGIVWSSFELPFGGGGDEGFLQSFFRQIERTGYTDQRSDDSPVLFAKDLFELLARLRHAGDYTLIRSLFIYADAGAAVSTSGRTSIVPVFADGMRAAMLVASSRFSASTRK